MNRALAQEIIDCLRLSGTPRTSLARLPTFGRREWQRALVWLHVSGLALYFWQRVKDLGAESMVPCEVRAALARNLQDNGLRIAAMAEEFDLINRGFEEAGVEYAVLKGFALVPDYCPHASLRTSYDYDYLLRADSLDRAHEALTAAGYVRRNKRGDHIVYAYSAGPLRLLRPEDLYSAQLTREVELHLSLWNADEEKICLEPEGDPLTRTCWHTWRNLRFRGLADEDALIFQALHAFWHVLHSGCRMSTLLEIAYFLENRSSNTRFWERVREKVQSVSQLGEVVGVVFSLAAGLFGPEVPAAARAWTSENLTPAEALWIEHYGWNLALNNFSGNKLSLFLHREFIQDPAVWREIRWRRLFPVHRLHHVAQASRHLFCFHKVTVEMQAHLIRWLSSHLSAPLGYAWEWPRWQRMLRQSSEARLAWDPLKGGPRAATVSPRTGSDDRIPQNRPPRI